jgi:recombination protein RecA
MAKKKTEPSGDSLLETTLNAINQKLGANTVSQWGSAPIRAYDVVSTSSIALDHALGIGGLPFGRIVEIYGPESSGKTTLTLHVIANAQKKGGLCAFIDAEHALDIGYAGALGVDVPSLLISQPDCGEDALEAAVMLAQSGAVNCIVIDSVAALTPRAELQGDMGDHHVGVQARMMSQAMRKLRGALHTTNTLCIFINQLRMKIGVMFGSPETTTGGNALKFYSSVRIDTRRIGAVKEKEVIIANRTRVKVVKNKCAPPFQECEFDIVFGEGISRPAELIELGVLTNIVDKAGAWISYGDGDESIRLGQGRLNAAAFLVENPAIATEIDAKIRVALKAKGLLPPKPRASKDKGKGKGKKKTAQGNSASDAAAELLAGKKGEGK